MNSLYFLKLSASNLKKNSPLYLPYIIMNIGIITLYYIMHAIGNNPGLSQMSGGTSLQYLLGFGIVTIGIFSCIFILYTNSFLMKRRKKEIGLYNVLGMEKRHIAKMMLVESVIVLMICLVLGLFSGIILSKLMFLILLKLLGFTGSFVFTISLPSVLNSIILFACILCIALVYNLMHIHLSNPVDLLKGGKVGEKEPKSKWLLTLIGVIALGSGYTIAQMVKAPLQALPVFFIAVVLVMIGTYALFTAGSIVVLKRLKQNKSFYYQSKHFIAISGLIYRMKQNAVGLANICILSTAVLVTLSTTISLYVGLEDALDNQFPHDIILSVHDTSEMRLDEITTQIQTRSETHAVETSDITSYVYTDFVVNAVAGKYIAAEPYFFDSNSMMIHLVSVDDYNTYANTAYALDTDEVIILSMGNSYVSEEITINDTTLNVVAQVDAFSDYKSNQSNWIDGFILFIKGDITLHPLFDGIESDTTTPSRRISFNMDKESLAFVWDVRETLFDKELINSFSSRALAKSDFITIYGGFLFVGLFLGALFLSATVMIIYYKQLSEGYDDKARFEILQNVGMSFKEIKASIKSQILLVFFLPLLTAMLHICFAFNVITKLLAIFNFTNTLLFFICTAITLLIFAAIYFLVYILTAKSYYKIVKSS